MKKSGKKNIGKKKNEKITDKNMQNTATDAVAVFPLQSVFVFLAGILLILMPLPRGSFFPKEKLVFSIALLLLGITAFAIISLFRQRVPWDSLHGFSPLLLMIAYWIPVVTFQWVVLWEALAMILYYIAAITVFLLIRALNREETYTRTLLNLMLASGLVVAFTALLGAADLWEYSDLVMGNRLAGTFQYPNTLAAWMMSLYFVANGLQLSEKPYWKKLIYAAIGFFMLFVFVFTYSRAAWLLFPVIALAYLVVIPGKNRLFMILTYAVTGITLLLAMMPFYNATTGDDAGGMSVLVIVLAATAVFALLQAGLLKSFDRLEEKGGKIIYGTLGALLVGASVFLFIALQTTEPLVFDNLDQEENRNQTLTRNIPDIIPSSEYELALEIEAQGGDEDQWPWLVRVDSRDGEGSLTNIFQHTAEPDESGSITLLFETMEETESLRIIFRNHFPETAVTFSEATIRNLDASEETAYEIPLRYQYLPEALVQRFESIDREEQSADTRMAYYRDSMAILGSHPLGAGGGAWDELYREYQSQPYFSRQVHNFFLQTAVETGIPGLLILGGMVGLIMAGLYQVFRKKDLLQISLHIGVVSLLAHSFLDFNFTYLSTFMLFWMMLALLESPEMGPLAKVPEKLRQKHLKGWILSLSLIPVLVLSMISWGAARSQETAGAYSQMGETQLAFDTLGQAASLDRLRPTYRTDLIRNLLQFYQAEANETYLNAADDHWQQGIRFAPRRRELLLLGAELKTLQGDASAARELLQLRIQEAPLDRTAYESVTGQYIFLTKQLMANNQSEAALETAREGGELLNLLNRSNEEAVVPQSVTGTFRNNLMTLRAWETFASSDLPFELSAEEELLYTHFLDLEYATGQSDSWRTWGREDAELETELTAKGLVTTNSGTDLGLAFTPNLEMEPNTEYSVWVDFEEISLEDPLRIHIIATDSDDNRTQHSHTHNPAEDGLQAFFTFTTTDDIEPGSQYVRFDHPGNDYGSFTIRGIIVTE